MGVGVDAAHTEDGAVEADFVHDRFAADSGEFVAVAVSVEFAHGEIFVCGQLIGLEGFVGFFEGVQVGVGRGDEFAVGVGENAGVEFKVGDDLAELHGHCFAAVAAAVSTLAVFFGDVVCEIHLHGVSFRGLPECFGCCECIEKRLKYEESQAG